VPTQVVSVLSLENPPEISENWENYKTDEKILKNCSINSLNL
jgi:hypothetical protein